MIIGVLKESYPGERRVALVPDSLSVCKRLGIELLLEQGAGDSSGYLDALYTAKGATVATRDDVLAKADVIAQVRSFGSNPTAGEADLAKITKNMTVIGFCDPLGEAQAARRVAETGCAQLSMELMPRITRAQSMDALSSMATIAGYKAVLIAADTLPKMFPMMMTAAGTITPAHAFVIGAGVAGLQAIASAKRLGAVVRGYDVRPAVKEQVESLGASFVEMDLETGSSEDKGGYAKAMDEEFYRKQRELMTRVVAEVDVVITTAAIPGKKSPVLITADMVKGMAPGSVIVDLAAERGGNCELTRADETVVEHGVTIHGPTNLPATVPYHASQMYAKNMTNFLTHLVKDGVLKLDLEDEITRGTLVTHQGRVVHERVCDLLGETPPPRPQPAADSTAQ
jgi:NAD(P) transhydrogenase subunit alpha